MVTILSRSILCHYSSVRLLCIKQLQSCISQSKCSISYSQKVCKKRKSLSQPKDKNVIYFTKIARQEDSENSEENLFKDEFRIKDSNLLRRHLTSEVSYTEQTLSDQKILRSSPSQKLIPYIRDRDGKYLYKYNIDKTLKNSKTLFTSKKKSKKHDNIYSKNFSFPNLNEVSSRDINLSIEDANSKDSNTLFATKRPECNTYPPESDPIAVSNYGSSSQGSISGSNLPEHCQNNIHSYANADNEVYTNEFSIGKKEHRNEFSTGNTVHSIECNTGDKIHNESNTGNIVHVIESYVDNEVRSKESSTDLLSSESNSVSEYYSCLDENAGMKDHLINPNIFRNEQLSREGCDVAISGDDPGGLETQATDHDLISPHLPTDRILSSYNLATFVNHSKNLQELVKLGVDFSRVEKIKGAANLLLRLDMVKDVQPFLLFLRDLGIPDEFFPNIITRNPLCLAEPKENLLLPVKYFNSKKFDKASVARILSDVPEVFTMAVVDIDGILGKYQKCFKLSGSEVRQVLTKTPKILFYKWINVMLLHDRMDKILGFTDHDLKTMILHSPSIFSSDEYHVEKTFQYVHNDMGISHELIVHWPKILEIRLFIIKDRHSFLQSLGRAQYDPTKENYVSLEALVTGDDSEFCISVAKTSLEQMDKFLRLH